MVLKLVSTTTYTFGTSASIRTGTFAAPGATSDGTTSVYVAFAFTSSVMANAMWPWVHVTAIGANTVSLRYYTLAAAITIKIYVVKR